MKSYEEVLRLPQAVPSRLLFQVGPNGEDPVADLVESEFRTDGLRVVQDSSSAVTVKSVSQDAVVKAKKHLTDWLACIQFSVISFPKASSSLLNRLQKESSLFLNNMPWVCGVDVGMANRCIEIRCRPEALEQVSGRIHDLVRSYGEEGGVLVVATRTTEAEKMEPSEGLPVYRFVRGIVIDDDIVSPVLSLPLSVFDTLESPSRPPEEDTHQLKVFTKTVKVEKSASIPDQVVRRLETAVGVGTRIAVLRKEEIVDIRCSQSLADVDLAERLVRACASRTMTEGCFLLQLPHKYRLDLDRIRTVEKSRKIVSVEVGKHSLLLLGRPEAVECAKTEIMRIVECSHSSFRGFYELEVKKTVDSEGLELSSNLKTGTMICKRVEAATVTCHVAVELIGNTLMVASPSQSLTDFVMSCVRHLLGKSVGPLLVEFTVAFPVPKNRITAANIQKVENKWGCIIEKNSFEAPLIIKPCDPSEAFDIVNVISWDVKARLGAAMDLLDQGRLFYDFASLKFSIGGGFLSGFVGDDLVSQRMREMISTAMDVVIIGGIVGGKDRECVLTAIDLLKGAEFVPLVQSRFCSLIELVDLEFDLDKIGVELGCVVRQSTRRPGNVEVYSKLSVRRCMARLVLQREATLTEVLDGWPMLTSRKKESLMSDEYEFPLNPKPRR